MQHRNSRGGYLGFSFCNENKKLFWRSNQVKCSKMHGIHAFTSAFFPVAYSSNPPIDFQNFWGSFPSGTGSTSLSKGKIKHHISGTYNFHTRCVSWHFYRLRDSACSNEQSESERYNQLFKVIYDWRERSAKRFRWECNLKKEPLFQQEKTALGQKNGYNKEFSNHWFCFQISKALQSWITVTGYTCHALETHWYKKTDRIKHC